MRAHVDACRTGASALTRQDVVCGVSAVRLDAKRTFNPPFRTLHAELRAAPRPHLIDACHRAFYADSAAQVCR